MGELVRSAFVFVLTLLGETCSAQASDPYGAKIVTDDILRFWQAFDEAAPGFSATPFQELYLDKGSRGLEDFIEGRITSAVNLARTVEVQQAFYRSIREKTLNVSTLEPKLRPYFVSFAELYPKAIFPDVYFVIGALNSGGTTSQNGLIIGTEIFSVSQDTSLDNLDPWLRSVVQPASLLPTIVIHELVHFQQPYREDSLLHQTIIEGSADFIAELVTGQNFNRHLQVWANPRARVLWDEFSKTMNTSDTSNWLYNGSNTKDRPADLGYWLGYEIAKAYYEKTPDKQQAIADIITVKDADAFLKASGYAARFR